MSYIEVNGVDLYYEIHGEGIPLVLVAGMASDSQSWQLVIKELSRYYRVIIFDNRGVGRTKPQDIAITIPQITDDCIALIRHLGLSSVSLLGHSMGGFVALDCAIRYPEYVSNLILAGTSAFNSKRNNALFYDWISYLEKGIDAKLWFKNMFYWIFSKRFFEDTESLNNAVRMAVEYPYPQSETAFKHQVEAIKSYDCQADLSGITSKTMILCGEEDLLFSPEEITHVLSSIPGVIFFTVKQAAHAMFLEKPDEIAKFIWDFLRS